MLILLVLILGMNRLATLSLSNTTDEMRLIASHYAAERGARWFVTYCNNGGRWDYSEAIDVEKNDTIYIYIKADPKVTNPKHVMSCAVLDGVSKSLPALVAAYKLQEKAAKLGFDWDELDPVWAKVSEEMDEFKEAIAQKDRENMEKEAGDVLFSLINLLRWYKISGENALNRTNTKFRQRFLHVEACVNQSDRSWEDFSLAELDAFWEEAKVQEK